MSILFIFYLSINLFGQNDDIIIDPIGYSCYRLKPDSTIRPLKLNDEYYGRVIINAECDTINNRLTNYEIAYAKLYSYKQKNDSIEIRPGLSYGNTEFIQRIFTKLTDHISYIGIEKNADDNCIIPKFYIPIKIE